MIHRETVRRLITLKFFYPFRSRFRNITVSTIDSIQGKEMDVVILSCARTEGIGFMGLQQRLNVALTRAKFSLFICGNFVSLQVRINLLGDSRQYYSPDDLF